MPHRIMLVLEDSAFLYFLGLLFAGSFATFLYALHPKDDDEPGEMEGGDRRYDKTVVCETSTRRILRPHREHSFSSHAQRALCASEPVFSSSNQWTRVLRRGSKHAPRSCKVDLSEPALYSCARGELRLSSASSREAPSAPSTPLSRRIETSQAAQSSQRSARKGKHKQQQSSGSLFYSHVVSVSIGEGKNRSDLNLKGLVSPNHFRHRSNLNMKGWDSAS